MKNLNFKVVRAFVAGLFLFSCSGQDDVMNLVSSPDTGSTVSADTPESTLTAKEEDAAFQDLFEKLDALHAKYTGSAQTRIIGGDNWTQGVIRVFPAAVLGDVIAFQKGMFQRLASITAASIKAAVADGKAHPHFDEWIDSKLPDKYLSRIGSSVTNYDALGSDLCQVIDKMYRLYMVQGKGWATMSDGQLQDAIIRQIIQTGYMLPPSYNPASVFIQFSTINSVVHANNYTRSLEVFSLNKLITQNESKTLIDFLNGLRMTTKTGALNYCIEYRHAIYSSPISSGSKDNLYSAISIGFASAHLWRDCTIHLN